MTHRDEMLELCAGYVLGNLSDTEKATLEAHLKEGCPTCDVELDRLARGAWAFASATPRLLEPPGLRSRVLSAVRTEPGKATKRAPIPMPRRRVAPAIAWVATAASIALAVFGVMQYREATRLQEELGVARGDVNRLQQEIQTEREWAALLAAPRARVVELQTTPAGLAQPHARIAYDPGTRRAVVAVSNFVAPPGKDYQLWGLTKSGPASLGLLRPDPSGTALIRLPNAGDPFTLTAFAVSLENTGGSPNPNAPTGPVVMLGKI